jgi:membrane fusion protein (multidrug efflux system)
MNTRISTNGNGTRAIGAWNGNGNGTSLLKKTEASERPPRVMSEELPQPSALPNGGRSRKAKLLIAIVAGAAVLVAGFGYWLHARNFQSTDDAYTTTHVHDISARVAGYVQSVNVDDNQFVKAGQVLAVLDQRDLKVAVDQAKAQTLQRRADIDQAQANFDRAKLDYDRAVDLYKTRVIAKSEFDSTTAAFKATNAALASARANLAAAEAAQANAELQLSYTTIVAPADGIVAKKTVETGHRIQPGQALMAVVEPNVWVLGNFKETQLARMRVGQHVDVKIDSVPGHTFSAHIDSLQPGTGSTFALLPPDNATGNFTKIVQRVPVKIVFDDLGSFRDRVVPGLSCLPKVSLGSKS